MMKQFIFAAACVAALASFAATVPKVGTTVSLGGGIYLYRSNRIFQDRPIAKEMMKNGVELCLYRGLEGEKIPPTEKNLVISLEQFNAVWLILDHEDQCPYPAATVGKALRTYVEMGGGLVINHSPGRYPEAPVDPFWNEAFAYLDMTRFHEEIADLSTMTNAGRRAVFHTDNLKVHPVTEGVGCLWLSAGNKYTGTWGVHAISYGPEWQTVVATGPNGRSYRKNKDTNDVDFSKPGHLAGECPVVAVRTLGLGRIVSIGVHKDNSGWCYNLDTWANLTERSDFCGRHSDNVKLLENAFKWASEPSARIAAFTKDYKPVEPNLPPYDRNAEFGGTKPMRWLELGAKIAPRKQFAAVVGLHSDLSDGMSSVAEYSAEAKKLGLAAIVFTDPLEALGSDGKLKELRRQCAAATDDALYVCPGVEYLDGSDIRWILAHERVAFPVLKSLCDQGEVPQWDGKRVLQRNNYGGHQNLYRGAIIDYKAVHATGNTAMSLAYFSGCIPKAYDVDREIADNVMDMRRESENVHRYAAMSYTRVTKASELVRAFRQSAMYADSKNAFKEIFNVPGGWGGHAMGEKHRDWVRCSGDATIERFEMRQFQGCDLVKIAVGATSASGLKTVSVVDGASRVLARFDAKGEKTFAAEFAIVYDRQSYPQVIVEDVSGGTAYSTPKWLFRYHAGLMRCGDNSNLLSQSPNLVFFANWNNCWCEFARYRYLPERHYHISEASLWDRELAQPTREAMSSCHAQWCDLRIKDSPILPHERVSNFTTFPLVEPGVVTILDQIQGEKLMERSAYGKRHTYAQGSLDRVTREISPFVHKRRVYHFVDRIDTWWRAVYREVIPAYRGGYSIVEGEISFPKATTLASDIELAKLNSVAPLGAVDFYASDKNASGNVASLKAGAYAAFYPDPKQWYGLVGLDGTDPSLRISAWGGEKSREGALVLGEKNKTYPAGTVLKYRFACGTFVEDAKGGDYLKWFAKMMNGTGFNAAAKKGAILGVDGMVETEAKDNVATLELGPCWFIQDYPVRIRGLVDNGTAYVVRDGRPVKPLAFAEGLAYSEVPLEDKAEWTFMNLFVADNADVRLTYLPSMIGHEKADLQVMNTTGHAITTRIRDVQNGTTFEVTVPAFGMTKGK